MFIVLFFVSTVLANSPPGYYQKANGKTGSVLKSSLHNIIDGHTAIKYTDKNNGDWFDDKNIDVWEALIYTDSACPINNKKCGDVRLLYLDEIRSYKRANRGKGKSDSWDREHVWPKSRGFAKKSQDGYTDLHHLRPADRNINGIHSNYGYDVGGKPVFDKLADGTQVATTMRIDSTNHSFEPSDRAKGQVARMIFYMAVRYENGDNIGNEKMPDLYIQDKNERIKKPWIGDLCTLLLWHNQFEVSDFERRRNDRVMSIQGNRNPFIDRPEWVNSIWGRSCHTEALRVQKP
ncbi:MAG: endonuclease [Saprospiraceae bacterium]|nr:endonuclease [Saprospiraceae bacterium]